MRLLLPLATVAVAVAALATLLRVVVLVWTAATAPAPCPDHAARQAHLVAVYGLVSERVDTVAAKARGHEQLAREIARYMEER